MIAIFVVGGALGGKHADDFNLPDSESQRAYDLLAERYPSVSGTSAFIVFHSSGGPLDAQADVVGSTLNSIAGLPKVVGVTNPLETEGSLSPDGTIGYAQVAYSEAANDLGTEPYVRLAAVVEDGRSSSLDIEIGGEYASWGSQTEPTSSEAIGRFEALSRSVAGHREGVDHHGPAEHLDRRAKSGFEGWMGRTFSVRLNARSRSASLRWRRLEGRGYPARLPQRPRDRRSPSPSRSLDEPQLIPLTRGYRCSCRLCLSPR